MPACTGDEWGEDSAVHRRACFVHPCTAKNPLVSAFAGLTWTRKINITSLSSLPLRLSSIDSHSINPY